MIITIERLGHLGDGIAQGPDGPIFAPGFLPGEEVEGDLNGDKLENARILTPSAQRVKPPCSHAKTCGGCQLQHGSDPFVAGWKQGVVRQALVQQGFSVPDLPPVITSPPASRRRATLSGRRTKSGALLGFHAKGRDLIVPIPGCKLLHPDLMATLPALEALVAFGGTRTTEQSLTVTRTLAGPDVSVIGGKPLDGAQQMEAARLVERFGLARLTWDGESVAQREEPQIALGRARVPMPPAAFLQATEAGESALVQVVKQALGPQKRIADLFCGLGTFALPLAEEAEVLALEGDATMIASLQKSIRNTQGLKRIEAKVQDLFRRPLEVEDMKGLTGVVIDPPRAGAEAQVQKLAESKVPVIAMVSCNPVTFARDVRILTQGGYSMDPPQVVDQFRWSTHVELVARFTKA